ncbi:MAG: magnesium/cobalt transporter CorA [Bacteroidetes bacterium]|nr:magnesium/cobalt transporter CorA [Bacteroidota bacterium]
MKNLPRPSKKPGLAPGTLIYTGHGQAEPAQLSVFSYSESTFEEIESASLMVLDKVHGSSSNYWINVSGIHDVELVEAVGLKMNLHQLVMEDIVHPHQRPKLEAYDNHLFMVAKMMYLDNEGQAVGEQISIVLGKNYVISFQERPEDIFQPVRDRLRTGKGLMRKMGADYMAYALLDLIVDHYFVILEEIGTQMEEFEETVAGHPSKDTMTAIRNQKKKLIAYRREMWPLRELLSGLMRDDSGLVRKKTHTYLRDVYDHAIQVIDLIETYRDLLSGLTDLYLSSLSHRMNEVMQVLTIIGSIFIPITFIAGVYGMNFQNMPELHWTYGYYAAWALMATTALSMIVFFKKKKWL